MKRPLLGLVVIMAVAAGGWRWHAATQARAQVAAPVPTAEVTRGSLVVTLPITGSLQSAQEIPVRAEVDGTIVELSPDNSAVKVGDFVYRLDTKDLEDQREQLRRALAEAEENVETQQADAETRITNSESNVTTAEEALKFEREKAEAERVKLEAQANFAAGELDRARRELARSERLAALSYIPGTKLDEAAKAFRKQEFEYKQIVAKQKDAEKTSAEKVKDREVARELARHALATNKADAINHAEEANVRAAEAARRLADVDKKIVQSTLTSPAAGLAVIQTNDHSWPERRPYRLGDQLDSGHSPVMIYDVNQMQVRCQIGEMDVTYVKQGQDAWVSTPADATKRYPGKVALVEGLAKEANVWQGGTPGKKVFEVLVTLEKTDPARLRPGMTVDLEIELDRVREATMVPIRAAFREQGKQVVYVARGKDFSRVPVTLGTRNDLLIEVKGGVEVGDTVALERPPAPPQGRRARGKG